MKAWVAWMDKWMPGANKADANHVYGYAVANLMLEIVHYLLVTLITVEPERRPHRSGKPF